MIKDLQVKRTSNQLCLWDSISLILTKVTQGECLWWFPGEILSQASGIWGFNRV
ncbi:MULTISPECIES: hypothetical protein [unclassified Siphonobacter]|uniref:hypothetical protein n=1 Tax=unclassified Siphonobacter TaxID=2635712 RepID=UPI0012FF504E|nr:MULTISPECIES: hypothetical protein [unclassified Siphonobacter]MDQ1089403.1 hypothetical protein [Siphonobacter sp. SORGH_AS_1065]